MCARRQACTHTHIHTPTHPFYSAWREIALTSHLRSQTTLELPEQVYPAALLDTVCVHVQVYVFKMEIGAYICLYSLCWRPGIYMWVFTGQIPVLEFDLHEPFCLSVCICVFLLLLCVQLGLHPLFFSTTSETAFRCSTRVLFIKWHMTKCCFCQPHLCFLLSFSQSHKVFFKLLLRWSCKKDLDHLTAVVVAAFICFTSCFASLIYTSELYKVETRVCLHSLSLSPQKLKSWIDIILILSCYYTKDIIILRCVLIRCTSLSFVHFDCKILTRSSLNN